MADEEALKKANVQEMERLLYVALTLVYTPSCWRPIESCSRKKAEQRQAHR